MQYIVFASCATLQPCNATAELHMKSVLVNHSTALCCRLVAQFSYRPAGDAALNGIATCGGRTKPGLFEGYHLRIGGKWSGDLYFYDIDKLQNGTLPKQTVSPVAEGTIQLLGELQHSLPLQHDQPPPAPKPVAETDNASGADDNDLEDIK